MIPNSENKKTEGGGTLVGSLEITLKQKNIRHVIKLIRDSVYTDKELAPLREYSTNAFDAHVVQSRMEGPSALERPIRITLPTLLEPHLKIRDFGPGMDRSEMEDVYLSIGESSKRGNNDETGSMGLGSKSGYAYGDSFIVTCWKNGRCSAYNLVLDDTKESGCRCDILFDKDCSLDDHGVEITVPIRDEHVKIFPSKALNFFKYWDHFPEIINLDETEKARVLSEVSAPAILSGEGWTVRPKQDRYANSESVAVMANIPYPINWGILADKITFSSNQEKLIFDFLSHNNVVFRVKNGELDFSVSREGLQYTDRTVKTLFSKVKEISDSILSVVMDRINKASTIWEAKRIYGSIFNGGYYSGNTDKDQMVDDTGFSGELYQLKSFFKDKLIWNGCFINSSTFDNIHYWDADEGLQSFSNGVSTSLMESLVLDGDKVKTHKASRKKCNVIFPYSRSVVVINDIYKKSAGRCVCKYILKNANPGNICKIYFLNFRNQAVKDAFYSHYKFDSVPVYKLSDWIGKYKDHYKANRINGGSKSLTDLNESDPIETWYVPVDGKLTTSSRYSPWGRDVINLRETEGYFIQRSISGNKDLVDFNTRRNIHIGDVSNAIHSLKDTFDFQISRINGLTQRSISAKWFSAAVAEEQWIPVSEFVSESVTEGYTDEIRQAFGYIRARSVSSHFKFGKFMIEAFRGRINDPESPINKLIEAEDAYGLSAKDIEKYKEVMSSLETLGYPVEVKYPVDIESVMKEVAKSYPLIDHLTDSHKFRQDKNDSGYYKVEKKLIDLIIDYVNLTDAKNTKNTSQVPDDNELVAA